VKIEKMILYALRNNRNLNLDEIKEIIQSVSKCKGDEIEKVVKRLIESSDIKDKESNLTLLAKARRKMIKPNNKVSYNDIKWGRRWTMVLFDIPERNKKIRDILRYKLKSLGFGMMQGSVWVRPADVTNEVRRFIRVKNIQWQVKVLSFNMTPPDEKEVIHRIWKMNKLDNEYQCFVRMTIKKFKHLKNYPFQNSKLLPIALDLLSRLAEKEYLNLYGKDPQLPATLQPKEWNGKRAYSIYRQLDKYLVRQ
jgi:phenylacetic acid degradation operon negative regulatory protein